MAFGLSQVQTAPKQGHGKLYPQASEGGAGRGLITSAVAIAGIGLLAAFVLPVALVLPVLSVALVLGAGAVALYAWARPARDQAITPWDVSGALAFLGIAAALLSDPEQVLPLMEQAQGRR